MNLTKFKQKLMLFNPEDLKGFLGRNLVDMLLEWLPENELLGRKGYLSDMIITLYGINKLSDRAFRKCFLSRFTEQELRSFCPFLAKKYESASIQELVEEISRHPWKNNQVSNHLLELLQIVEQVFDSKSESEPSREEINAPEKFYELLDYQYYIRQQVIGVLTADGELKKMLVHMPTGTGKTKTAMHTLIHHFNFNLKKQGIVIWMAHSNELLQQAYNTFADVWKHIGNGEVTAFRLWGNHDTIPTETPLNGVVFCGFSKLISVSKSNESLFNRLVSDCRLLVVDEAHKAAAIETKKIIRNLMTKKGDDGDRALVGLTATPGRNAADAIGINTLVTMFDNRQIGIDTELLARLNYSSFKAQNTEPERDVIKYFQDRKILARLIRNRLTYPEGLTPSELSKLKNTAISNGYDGTDFSKTFLEAIGRNRNRNKAILDRLVQLNMSNYPTIVFACSVEHGKLLSAALSLEGIENACVFGEMNPVDRAEAIRRFKDKIDTLNILINFEVLTTGFDATNIKCVFITRPTQSVVLYSQMIGRGLRGPQMGGNEECLLVDIEDNLAKYDVSMAFKFFNNYWSN